MADQSTCYRPETLSPTADAGVTLVRATLNAINTAVDPQQALLEALQSGALRALQVTGNAQKVGELFAMLDTFSTQFNLIEP